MDQQLIITGLEDRAKAINLSIAELCRRADVHPTTFSRWKLSEKNPEPVGASMKSLTALDHQLAKAEAEFAPASPPGSEMEREAGDASDLPPLEQRPH